MTPYPEYKPTGLPWLPEIPREWEITRGKNLFYKATRPVADDAEVVTCFRDGQVTLRKNRRLNGFTESLKEFGYQGIKKGDLVIHVMDAFAGAVGVSDSDGKGTPVYSVCVAKTDKISNYYYAYIIREMAKRGYIQSLYRGIRERSSDFRFEVFAAQYLPQPPSGEQAQIVRYLDAMTTKINKLIRAKKKEIALLQEQKQDIISLMMRNDIEKNDNSVLPDGWKRMRMKYTSNQPLQYGANAVGIPFDERAIRYIRITDIDSRGKLKNLDKQSLPKEIGKEYLLKDGDILFARCGGTVGKTYLYHQSDGVCCYAGYLIKYSPNSQIILPEYIYLYTQSSAYNKWLKKVFIQATIQNVSAEKYKNFEIIIPPLDEQQRILVILDCELQKNFKAIQNKQKQIEYLLEYKNSLISSVVTGQVDVRNIAVEDVLPDDLVPEENDTAADPEEEQPVTESEE